MHLTEEEILANVKSSINELRAERNRYEQIQSGDGRDEKRSLTEDEKRRKRSIQSDLGERYEQVSRLEQRMAAEAIADESRDPLGDPRNEDNGPPDELRDGSLAALIEGRSESAVLEYRDFLLSDPAIGQPTAQTKMVREFYEVLGTMSGIWRAAGKLPTGADENVYRLPVLESHGTADQELPEGDAITESDGGMTQVDFNAYRYPTIQNFSNTLWNSSTVDTQRLVTRVLGQRLVGAYRDRLATGTGSGQPQGITVGAGAGITAASDVTVTDEELVDLTHSVASEYRTTQLSSFVMADSSWQVVRKLKDGDGRFLTGDLGNGADLRLLGYPVVIDASVPAMATGNNAIVFGAVEHAFIIRHLDVRIDASEHYKFHEDERSFRAIIALDSRVVDSNAIKVLTMG